MILKFILLTSFCFNINNEIKCGQYLRDNLSDASECELMADAIGKAQKRKMLKREGNLVEYRAQCIAIDSNGYNVDHSFKISYNIL
tara:strand:- start:300 stop:557 length:258 start_codon:yes stop_codon:yes gene_type:complete